MLEFQQHLENAASAQSYTREYFATPYPQRAAPQNLERFEGIPPEEQLFAFDRPMQGFEFARDENGDYWVIKDDTIIPDLLEQQQREVVMRFGALVNTPVIEYRIAEIPWQDNRRRDISRFLPNAIEADFYQELHGVSGEISENWTRGLAKLWVLNYMMGLTGDLQAVITTDGSVVLIDYFTPWLFDPNNVGLGDDYVNATKQDVAAQKEALFEYSHVLGLKKLPVYSQDLRQEIERAAQLTDDELYSLIADLPSEASPRGVLIENFRAVCLEGLQWRRDNIQEVFEQAFAHEKKPADTRKFKLPNLFAILGRMKGPRRKI